MNNQNFTQLQLFTIGDLSEKTGVNSVTLRAWERRYGLLKPARTEKGHRLYSEGDAERVVQILALIERGVPLRKIRGLLGQAGQLIHVEQEEDAQQLQKDLLLPLEQCNLPRLASSLQQMFQQYPVAWCNQQVIEPLFTALAGHTFAAVLGELLQAELIRFAARYLPASKARKKGAVWYVLAGFPTAPWRALMLSLELQEKQHACQWLPGDFSLSAAEQLAALQPDVFLLYCLDGVPNDKQKQQLYELLSNNPKLYLYGTAAELAFTQLDVESSALRQRILQKPSDLVLKA